jgi:thiamine-phosphate pyrophosphorylase
MPDTPTAKLYLIAPASPALGAFPDTLAALLDGFEVACVRMGAAGADEDALSRMADALRPVCHARDVPLVLVDHFRLARRLGLDGVHLSDGARQLRAARKELPRDAIIGAYAHASRHEGLTAGEIGADYVSFGPMTPSSLGDGALAPGELFQWWSEMIEIPVVAEGGLTPEIASDLARAADFLALGDELWSNARDPASALADFAERLA